MLSLTSAELEMYRATAQRRVADAEQTRQVRQKRAWQLARQAADLLKTEFQATKVIVFGSLVQEEMFTLWSDVDLAAWGLDSRDTLRALGRVYDLDDEIEVNLVDVTTAFPEILQSIVQEGVEL